MGGCLSNDTKEVTWNIRASREVSCHSFSWALPHVSISWFFDMVLMSLAEMSVCEDLQGTTKLVTDGFLVCKASLSDLATVFNAS